MFVHTPPESVHALPIEGLRSPDITFWSVWGNGELLGCGALKELDPQHGEIKSMRTASAHLRKGVARAVVHHIIAEATRRGHRRLTLATSSMATFSPARQLFRPISVTNCASHRSLPERRCCCPGDAHEPIFVRCSNRDRVVHERK